MGTMLRDDRPVSRDEWFETSEQIALSVDHKGYVYGALDRAWSSLRSCSLRQDAGGTSGVGLCRRRATALCLLRDLSGYAQ